MKAGKRILVVDDDPGMRALLRRAAERVGLDAHEAGSLNAALLRAHEVLPSGLVVDWDLNDGTGGELYRMLRTRLGSQLPAILITGRRSHLRKADEEPFGDVLQKPCEWATLLDAMRGLRWRARQRANSSRVLRPVVSDILTSGPMAEGDR